MLDTDFPERRQRHPLASLLLVFVLSLIGFVMIGPLIGLIISLPFYDGSFMEMAGQFENPTAHPGLRIPLYIMQGCATLIGLIVIPALFIRSEGHSFVGLLKQNQTPLLAVILSVVLVMVFMGVNSIFIEWNQGFHFPDFARGFEEWAREKEDVAAELTKFLTEFRSAGELLLALFVIAVLPAVGEEFLFRGLIQNYLRKLTPNPHVAIWIAAALFSAIHFQFFGFVPRLFLGALFGYIYFWSGSLWLAIAAHFANNAFSILAIYFYQQGAFEYDLDKPEAVPLNIVIISALLTAGLLYYFYRQFERQPKTNPL